MESGNEPGVRYLRVALGRALATPLSRAVWIGSGLLWLALDQSGLSTAASAVCAAASALVVQTAAIAVMAQSPDFLREARRTFRQGEARRLLQQVARDDHVDAATVQRLNRIVSDYETAHSQSVAGDVPRYARGAMGEAVARMSELVERAFDLTRHRGKLTAYLAGVNRPDLYGQQASLRLRLRQAQDEVLRGQIEQSLRFKDTEIRAYDGIQGVVARIDGQLESLECAFAALKARILHFKLADKAEWHEELGTAMDDDLRALTSQIDVLDASVREALTLRGG
uniref:Uncharacterized protein n=1 Tax=uncultured Armatimonadetes bacterium TaxID=157466 RepID=A0A6J4J6Q9_9BACT|nr:hypothetical protein AVDCRST_MAG63-2927 [uncultured Armatimonadetes bacterium]